ncbi:hypothetical protein N7513_008064 [Penicillium frequentans]|nr:hypothetical protein N7513_008064 [Penicillium glabrum]
MRLAFGQITVHSRPAATTNHGCLWVNLRQDPS